MKLVVNYIFLYSFLPPQKVSVAVVGNRQKKQTKKKQNKKKKKTNKNRMSGSIILWSTLLFFFLHPIISWESKGEYVYGFLHHVIFLPCCLFGFWWSCCLNWNCNQATDVSLHNNNRSRLPGSNRPSSANAVPLNPTPFAGSEHYMVCLTNCFQMIYINLRFRKQN